MLHLIREVKEVRGRRLRLLGFEKLQNGLVLDGTSVDLSEDTKTTARRPLQPLSMSG